MSSRYLIFAGTSEGHQLAKNLANADLLDVADFCVATEYGEQILADVPDTHILTGRMDLAEIEALLSDNDYQTVIDATHPYAEEVTDNLKKASSKLHVEYMRLLRTDDRKRLVDHNNIALTKSLDEAIELLNESTDKFLLTTGAKELKAFKETKDFTERAVARVLPSEKSLQNCLEVGLAPANIICMQGPFTEAMNIATMEQYSTKILVTKNTGIRGGFYAKTAVADHGFKVIVIDRPIEESGYSLEEISKLIIEREK